MGVKGTREAVEAKENEIRITNRKGTKIDFVEDAITLLEEKGFDLISLKAMGGAIPKTVLTAETIKRKIPGLHQIFNLESNTIVDVCEPLEEGLRQVTTERRVSSINIILSKNPLDANDPGYQLPLTEEEKEQEISIPAPIKRGRRNRRGRNVISRDSPEKESESETE